MKNHLLFLTIVIMGLPNIGFGGDQKLSIKADLVWYSNGIWKLDIEEYGDAGGARFTYEADRKNVYDKVSGLRVQPILKRKTLSREQVAQIEEVINGNKFFELRKYLAPKVFHFHRPKYRLNICFDDECHNVALFNIKRLPKHLLADFERIKVVWHLLWSFVTGPEFDKPHVRL